MCDIDDLRQRRVNTLSGGEQQRVHFARALLQLWPLIEAGDARYLLLDEPTASLDVAHELLVLKLARQAADAGLGVFVILHDINLAARFADEVVLLQSGRIVDIGAPEDVLTSCALSRVYKTKVLVEHHKMLNRLVIHT